MLFNPKVGLTPSWLSRGRYPTILKREQKVVKVRILQSSRDVKKTTMGSSGFKRCQKENRHIKISYVSKSSPVNNKLCKMNKWIKQAQ